MRMVLGAQVHGTLYRCLSLNRNKGQVRCFDQGKMLEKYIDIGANLLDGMYRGEYHGTSYHPGDLNEVLERSWSAGLDRILVTAGTLQEAQCALTLCRKYDNLYTTVGIHPTRGNEWASYDGGPEVYVEELERVIRDGMTDGKVVAIGECGLDYDRTEFCDIEIQKICFREHFKLSQKYKLPMFLHSRSSGKDMVEILNDHIEMMPKGGVVHSFDGSIDDLSSLLKIKNIFIGINGCSLKTEDNLQVAAKVPLERLMLETDAPWCGIRATHASSRYLKTEIIAKDKKKYDASLQVKGRNEPCNIVQVCEVMAGITGIPTQDIAKMAHENALKVFFEKV